MHPVADLARVPTRPRRPEYLLVIGLVLWAVAEAALSGPGTPGAVALALAWSAPALLVRTAPLVGLVVVCAVFLLVASTPAEPVGAMPFPAILVLTFGCGLWVSSTAWSVAGGVLAVAAVGTAQAIGFYGVDNAAQVVVAAFFVGGAWTAGRTIHLRAEQLRRAEARAGSAARAAVLAERARIAHELHDVVAHAVSVIAVQAGAAEDLLDRDPDSARVHLGHARAGAQEAMTEMRRLLEVLDEAPAEREPLPRIERVDELVERTREAGVEVTLRRTGEAGTLPAAVELTGYRVLQEALTNVRKHVPRGRADVGVHVHPDRVELVVTSSPAGPAGPVGGRGLAGMAERVRVFGGRLSAGREDDRFTVHAVLPRDRA